MIRIHQVYSLKFALATALESEGSCSESAELCYSCELVFYYYGICWHLGVVKNIYMTIFCNRI